MFDVVDEPLIAISGDTAIEGLLVCELMFVFSTKTRDQDDGCRRARQHGRQNYWLWKSRVWTTPYRKPFAVRGATFTWRMLLNIVMRSLKMR
jgi:hypothetical protein